MTFAFYADIATRSALYLQLESFNYVNQQNNNISPIYTLQI